MDNHHNHVLLGVTAGIACYKAPEILRCLQKLGCEVRVMMTEDALKFIGKATFEALSGHEVVVDTFESTDSAIPHIDAASWADCIVVAPASANTLAKMACGMADNCLLATLVAKRSTCLIAPAMNTYMWENPVTQQNVETLKNLGFVFVEPDTGRLACGDTGSGKLPSPEAIAQATVLQMEKDREAQAEKAKLTGILKGKKVLITAGPTREAIDPVRFITNPSTGKMGYALARAAVSAGAEVCLVSGPVSLDCPDKVQRIDVISADEMFDQAVSHASDAQIIICTAAVGDFKPAHYNPSKIKKDKQGMDCIELVPNKDILYHLSQTRAGNQVVVGFAAETDDCIENAKKKLAKKRCDMIVVNDVSHAQSTFGSSTNKVVLVEDTGLCDLECMDKQDLANILIEHIAHIYTSKQQ